MRGVEILKPLATHRRILASERQNVEITLDGGFIVVGERINPTGKKKLQAELREGRLESGSRDGDGAGGERCTHSRYQYGNEWY